MEGGLYICFVDHTVVKYLLTFITFRVEVGYVLDELNLSLYCLI